jgi:hypothetical protein
VTFRLVFIDSVAPIIVFWVLTRCRKFGMSRRYRDVQNPGYTKQRHPEDEASSLHQTFATNLLLSTWKDMSGCRHVKLFTGRPSKKRADDLLKLGRHQLKMVVAILTGHAPVREHLRIMGLFNRDPSCRFCGMEAETVQHITCSCEALARQRYHFFGKLSVEPKEISTASIRDLCLFIRETGLLNLC